jgi:diphosphomevalonate decarboxylase
MSTNLQSAAVRAYANIALVKYWGKRDAALNLPAVGSLSITLEALATETQVRFDPNLAEDDISLNGERSVKAARRISKTLDLLRDQAQISTKALVVSRNNFPTAAGLASSASGFAALVSAAAQALDLSVSDARLSEWARRGSGSAARSIFGGFVDMAHGIAVDGSDSIARPLHEASHWPLEVVIAITSEASKKVGSTVGMDHTMATSPYYSAWVDGAEADLAAARSAIAARDFDALAQVSEYSCLKMHASALAANPGVLYWNAATTNGIHTVRELRQQGVPVFFTIDAGPQLKAVCEPSATAQVKAALAAMPGVQRVITTAMGPGVTRIEDFA